MVDEHALRAEIERLRAALEKLHDDVQVLIDSSEGVYGLHLNGDPAPWSEITEGGRFEAWLLALVDAREALAALAPAEGKGDGWLPIESAPKDGTTVLLFCVPNEVATLRPHIAAGYWKASNGFVSPGLWQLHQAVGPSFKPTHWRIEPAAPTTTRED